MKSTAYALLLFLLVGLFPVGQGTARAEEVSPSGQKLLESDAIVKASPYGEKLVWSYHGGDKPMPWSQFKPNDFASIPIRFDSAGARSVGRVPAPGVHPRVFFSPEDLPAIRRRISETRAGREAWKNVLAYANTLKLTYDEKAEYAKPDWMKGGFGVHGRVPLFRIGGYGKREDYFALLAAGKKPEKDFAAFMPAAAVEALRCIVEDDAGAAKTLAKAVVTAVHLEQERRQTADKPVAPGQPPRPSTARIWAISLGMTYDFIFNWMTEEQKRIVHDELVTLSAWNDNYGTFNAADGSRSNWATFSYWVFDLLAIEGEPGFNDLKFRGFYRGWRNFMTVSYFDSGAVFEGEGKSLLGLDAVVGFDRLADKYHLQPLSHHPIIRTHLGSFTASSMLPTRDQFVCFDILGAMGRGVCTPVDVVVAKYLYPDDKRIDLVYRAVVGEDYERLPDRCDHLWNAIVLCALFATDYDRTNTPERLGLPPTFFCGQRALMMTRSSWDKEAAFLTMHVRGASGGHPYRDRNGIMLSAKGRTWVTIPGHGGETAGWKCSTVLIDGREQSNTTPGRVVDYVDQPQASFLIGDAKYCWDWIWNSTSKNKAGKPASRADVLQGEADTGAGWKLVDQSFNDFAWTKNPAESYSRPMKLSPHWLAPDGVVSAVTRQVNTPVIKSFRTAGLVRGSRPYALVVDDIQRNALPARYDWNLTLADDLVLVKRALPSALAGDVVLAGSSSLGPAGVIKYGEPALLVRILDQKGEPSAPVVNSREKVNLLTLSTRAVAPDFKIMLYPFRSGDPLPATSWNSGHSEMVVEFPDQKDRITFSPADSGKTDLRIERGGQEIIKLNRPVVALADPETDRLNESLKQLPQKLASIKQFDPNQLPGLVASWSFDKITDGLFPGNSAGVPGIPATDATVEPGRLAGAGRFPKSKSGVVVPLNLKEKITTAFTVAFWIKSDPNPVGCLLDIKYFEVFSLDMVQGALRFNAQGKWFYGGTNSASMLGDWTHFAVTCDGQSMILYRDGTPLMTLPGDRKLGLPENFTLGKDGFQGAYADLRIYDRALDAGTVERLYLLGNCAESKPIKSVAP